MLKRNKKRVLTVLAVAIALTGCGGSEANQNQPIVSESPSQSTPESSPLTGFAGDLQYVKNGQYTYIWVFSRKDGKPLDKDDSAFLRTNAPQVVDWVITDEGKRVIAGTNFDLAEGNLGLLKRRFNAEDYTGR